MKKTIKRILCGVLATAIALSTFFLGSSLINGDILSREVLAATDEYTYSGKVPKYIFMFIGDGMSYPQIQATNYYKGILENGKIDPENGNYPKPDNLLFTGFPVVGSVTTYDSTSLCPDSASTATSLSTGKKTLSSVINMDETKKISYETITEKLKKQLGYKVGIVTSVNLDHATPAAYYSHVPSRGQYYNIGLDLIKSGFDYFAGGAFLSDSSKEVKEQGKEKIASLAQKNGYTVADTKQKFNALTNNSGKVLAIAPSNELEEGTGALKYNLDRKENELTLADYTKKGIDILSKNSKGFFMMVEGGKIDWACHANDAASTIQDTIAFDDAIKTAVDFYNQHPDDTLIIVTGDHETGGLTIGFAGTNYDTYLEKLTNQKMSYTEFDKLIKNYKANNTTFAEALKDVKKYFGLITASDADAKNNPEMVLEDYELQRLKDAYDLSMKNDKITLNQEEYVLYGTYEPFSVTLTHVLNNKSGITFSSYSHTGLPVPLYAKGKGQELFTGHYDNTDVFNMLKAITKVK